MLPRKLDYTDSGPLIFCCLSEVLFKVEEMSRSVRGLKKVSDPKKFLSYTIQNSSGMSILKDWGYNMDQISIL